MKQIFKSGKIITMDNEKIINCVIVENGIIEFAGDMKDVDIKEVDSFDEIIDLENKTMLPAFIDAHSHMPSYAKLLAVADLNGVKNFEEILQRLKKYKEDSKLDDNEMIVGFGYDNNFLLEKEHPSIKQLDEFKNPVLISHKSGHMGVLNSAGLKLFSIDENSVSPEGGIIKKDDNGMPTGYLEETAFMKVAFSVASPNSEKLNDLIKRGQEIYAKNGIATAQDGAVKKGDFSNLEYYAKNNAFYLDIVAYIDITENKEEMDKEYQNYKEYVNNFRIGGYKLFLDGSPQGRTAWMRKPYIDDENYFGYPIFKDEDVIKFFKIAIDEKVQILVHCNGDAACEQMIRCYEIALDKKESEIRPVMIHAQLLQKDQLDKVKKLNIITSFFIAHTKYWADIHIDNFGKEIGENISPANSAIKKGIMYTFHQDSPVIMPNMLETIQAAVTRTSINGTKLNQDECISVYDAIKGVTINAAYQYFEEDIKGSIEVGKEANFIILDKDILEIDKEKIEEIKILKTYKKGQEIFSLF